MLTLEAFRATRKWQDDLQSATGYTIADDEAVEGFTYEGGLYIVANGGGAAPAIYTLYLMSDCEDSGDLEALERKLYDFAVEEGYLS